MSLTGNRRVGRRVDLQTNQGAPLGTFSGVTQGAIIMSTASTIKSSGTIQVENVVGRDWTQVRLAPFHIINDIEYPLGVFIASTPNFLESTWGTTRVLEVYDRLAALAEDATDAWITFPTGTVVTTAVTDLITSTGEKAGAVTPSAATLRTDQTFEPGTSKLAIINDLLDAAGFFSIWCDEHGQYQLTPYTAPQNRPIAWTFEDSTKAVHSPEHSGTEDLYKIPNRVVAVAQGIGDVPDLVSVAVNENPDSPYSFQSRGRWITTTISDAKATSQAVLDAYAQRRLQELSSVTATKIIKHGYLPLRLNDAVLFKGRRHVVTRMEIPLDSTELMQTTLREVVDT